MAGGSSELPLWLEIVANDDDGTNHKFPSSVHKVLSNDDLLMEILLRLPIVSLRLFKSVSKQWLSLITSHSFTLARTRIPKVDPPSGLFIGRDSCGPNKYDFVSFDPRIPAKRSIHFSYNSEVHIRKSCNGLLLCWVRGDHHEYCVYNPLISMFKMLPPMHDLKYELNGFEDIYMAFDPTKSPCYKVVHVGKVYIDDDDDDGFDCTSIIIQTYSSETGVWSVWDDRFSDRSFGFFEAIYWNGAIHFLNYGEPFHVKLDIVDRPVLTNIQAPPPLTAEGEFYCDRKFFTSHGSLLLLCKDSHHSRHLNIYEMKNEYSKWSVKYFVNVDDMMRPFPTWRLPADWGCDDILSILLGEREEDSFMVIEVFGKVLQYKFLSETVTKLLDLGKVVLRHDCHDFVASFSHV